MEKSFVGEDNSFFYYRQYFLSTFKLFKNAFLKLIIIN